MAIVSTVAIIYFLQNPISCPRGQRQVTGGVMDYTALTMTVHHLQEAINQAIKVDKDGRLKREEEWTWNMLTLAKVTSYFEKELEDLDTFHLVMGSDR